MDYFTVLNDDAIMLLVAHITESKRPPRTILRTLASLSRTCTAAHRSVHGRLHELRGLPVEVWEATSRSVPAQLTWTLDKFAELDEERLYSPAFRHGPHTWRLLLFPNGDEVERHRPGAPPHLSLYVDVADAAMLPPGWVREAHFTLSVISRRRPSKTLVRYARHDFEAAARDWGFRELLPLSELEDADAGFVPRGGSLTLHAKVWGVTDTMRVAERAAAQQLYRARAGGGSSAVGASTASSTSAGTEEASQGERPRRSLASSGLSALRRGVQSLFAARRTSRQRRDLYLVTDGHGVNPPTVTSPR